jgi:anti-anti-sigma regulatory factor
MASAGIRMLVFTKQKLGAAVDIYVVAANEQIVNTLEMTGVDKSVIFVDEFEPAASTR